LPALAILHVVPKSNIARIRHRNKDYTTSIVSALLEQILQKTNLAIIHMESNNSPAIKAYIKVGFKPYKKYFVARV